MKFTQQENQFLQIDGESPIEIQPILKEASTRNYYRLHYNSFQRILCIDENFQDESYSFLQVQKFLKHSGILVPEIIKFDTTLNFIMQEDSGQKDLTSIFDEEQYIREVKKSIDTIHLLQSLEPIPLINNKSFDKEKNLFELNHTFNGFKEFAKFYKISITINHELFTFMEEASEFLAKYEPKVICHRDLHGRNILLNKNSEQVLIDFQDMMMGSAFYDLSSIVYDAYRPIGSADREALYQYFISKLQDKIPRMREYYLTQCLQRSFKALGTYLVQFHKQKNPRFKESILKSLIQLLEITQLGMFSDQCYVFFFMFKKELEENELFQQAK